MDFTIRRAAADEYDAVIDLVWMTFLEFEAPDYSLEGTESFRKDIVDNRDFREACRSGKNRIWIALAGSRLVGVMAMRGESHICLVFTHRAWQRQGIATAIFRQLVADVRRENPGITGITLNSSPFGLPFYHRIGFVDQGPERTLNGIRFTPMRYAL